MIYISLILILSIFESVRGPTVTPLRANVTKEDQRALIKCHVLLGTTAYELMKMLPRIAGSKAYKERQIYNIYRQFKEGLLTCDDEPRSGRPCTATDQDHEEDLKNLSDEQKCWTTEELPFRLGISKKSTIRLIKELELRKVASHWVPYELKPEQKEYRVKISEEHLERFNDDTGFINRIIAIDETWIKSYDPRDVTGSGEW